MPEWWTYSLSDFLLFSPRTYYRLIERHNAALWPTQVVTTALGIVAAIVIARGGARAGRAVAGALAIGWAWVGWMFVFRRYTTINWAAAYVAPLFAVEAGLLAWLGVKGPVRFGWRSGAAGPAGAVLFGVAICYPLLAPVLGRGWLQAEVVGVVPDPTALATLGLLLAAEASRRSRWVLLAIPLLWCLLSGATLWAMGSPEAWILLGASALTLGLAATGLSGSSSRRTP